MKTIQHHGHVCIIHVLIDMKHISNRHIDTHGSIDQDMFFIGDQRFLNTCIHVVVKEENELL